MFIPGGDTALTLKDAVEMIIFAFYGGMNYRLLREHGEKIKDLEPKVSDHGERLVVIETEHAINHQHRR